MSPPHGATSNGSVAATERSPLLDNGANGNAEQRGSDIPLADEPSTAKLVLTLGSCWVGVFLAALGELHEVIVRIIASSAFISLICADAEKTPRLSPTLAHQYPTLSTLLLCFPGLLPLILLPTLLSSR